MTEKKSHNKKWIALGITLAVIFLLAAGIRLSLKSNWLLDKVRDVVVEQANNQLNGTLSVETIRGDLLRGITIKQILLTGDNQEQIARIDSVTLSYRLFALMRGPHELDNVVVSGADFWVTQHEDSTWNVLNLIDPEEPEPEETDPLYWALSNVDISDANIYVTSEYLLPDGFLNIRHLHTNLRGGAREDGFYGAIDVLEFQLEEARLPEPVALYLEGSGTDEKYTLESLVINTGRTMLRAQGSYEEDGRLDQSLNVTPLSWRDLALYGEDLPLRQDLNISLSASGSLADLSVALNLTAVGAEEIILSAGLDLSDQPALTRAEFTSKELNLPLLTGVEEWPVFGSIRLAGDGTVPFDDLQQAQFAGQLLAGEIQMEPYSLDRFESEFSFENGSGNLDLQLNHQHQQIAMHATIRDLFDELPGWQATIRADNWNPATWLADETLDANLNLRLDAGGEGIDPERFRADIEAAIAGTRYGEQPFSELRLAGTINPQQANGMVTGRLDRSEIETTIEINNWLDDPRYTFHLAIREFNTAELAGLEHFPTHINGTLSGEGRSFDIDELYLNAEMELDSSIVNGEIIDAFRANIRVENSFAWIEQGTLQSPIADASFSARQHVSDFLNSENRLQFEAVLKDLYPIAPLFGFEELVAEGSLHGHLARNETGILQFDGGFEFENIQVDTLFSSTKMSSTITSYLYDEPEIVVALEMIEPAVMAIEMQDLHVNAKTIIKEAEITGELDLLLRNGDESSLFHAGVFLADSTRMVLTTHQMVFDTELKTLSLMAPFDLTYAGEVLRMDTLAISSGDEDAYLKLWIPHLDSLRQEAGLDARNLNLGELQQTIIEQSYMDAFLSGTVEVVNSPEDLRFTATGLLRDIRYEEGEMDSLRFDASLAEEWLDAELNGWLANNRILDGHLRVPFLPGDPQTFDDQFFEREVSGRFHISSTGLDYWLSFTPDGVPEQTEGMISLNAELSGQAGNPELTGTLAITEGLFSGIRVDRIGVELDYLHETGSVDFNGNVVKDQKSILSFDASLPFLVDLRQAEVLLPSDDDEVYMTVRTDDFDMALFNSYVDPAVLRNIAGRIEGGVTLSGTMANLQTSGELRISGGRMRVVEAGITLSDISSGILFEPDQIALRQFTMTSGPGRLRANGTIGLDAMQPGEMNLEITANQFRAINTPEYNFLVNLQSRLNGTFDAPRLSGSLTFLTGLVNLQDFGDQAVEVVVLDDEEEPEPFEFYEALAMEMNVNFGSQFLIRNRQYLDMDLALTGSVDLLKDPYEEIQLFGTLEGTRGFVRPLGRNFELDEAVVSFFGPMDNPQMNVRAVYEPPQAAGVRIFYVIEGTLQDPEFRFDSDPALELQDIISYTLFGKPFYDLDSWEQVVAGSGSSPTAADVAIDVLLDRVEMLASQRLGIDVVQIDNTRSGSNNTTSIKTGWYLNQRTFFAILNEVGGARPKTLFMLEYLLRENLELIITQGDDSREGVDLRWKLDY